MNLRLVAGFAFSYLLSVNAAAFSVIKDTGVTTVSRAVSFERATLDQEISKLPIGTTIVLNLSGWRESTDLNTLMTENSGWRHSELRLGAKDVVHCYSLLKPDSGQDLEEIGPTQFMIEKNEVLRTLSTVNSVNGKLVLKSDKGIVELSCNREAIYYDTPAARKSVDRFESRITVPSVEQFMGVLPFIVRIQFR